MTQVERLTAEFNELDRVTPRPLTKEDYAICAEQFFRDGQVDHIKETQGILKSGIESVEAKLRDLANDNKELRLQAKFWEDAHAKLEDKVKSILFSYDLSVFDKIQSLQKLFINENT